MIGGILKDPWRAGLKLGPQLVWRVIAGKVGLGNGLIVGLLKGCLDHGCTVLTNAGVKCLLTDAGTITGVEAVIDGKPTTIRAARGVVLATGGFDWAPDYMPEYFPGIQQIGAARPRWRCWRNRSGSTHRSSSPPCSALMVGRRTASTATSIAARRRGSAITLATRKKVWRSAGSRSRRSSPHRSSMPASAPRAVRAPTHAAR